MNRLILISAVCMQFGWIFGAPNPEGVGAYAYQDSDGNRVELIYPIAHVQPLPPLKPLPPLRPLWFHPLRITPSLPLLRPLRPLQPLRPLHLPLFHPLQLLAFNPLQILPPPPSFESRTIRPISSLPPLQPLRPLLPLKPLYSLPSPIQPLQVSPFHSWNLFPSVQYRTVAPLKLLQPLRSLSSLSLLQLLSSLLGYRPQQDPLSPLFPHLPLRPLPLQPLPSLFPYQPLQVSPFYPWSSFRPLLPLQPSLIPLNTEFPFNGGFSNFGMPNFGPQNYGQYGPNSAYASGSVMPGYSHQVAAVNPGNPNQPNVDIKNRFGEDGKGGNGYMSVSSSSYATSSNVNGQEQAHRGAETVVNNNGVVHRYKVES
ncbi:uncharacterized protein LOC133518798 isoform X1 [Cydia pomonella]|uniref:uncharacterized protein LOC133518798 isoform X1 n=1 Tax=Cydia pomonella TaxID=82600 RepID=UPI002ADD65DB|nr:uncharacterized protein LOC133518798 isoform X1 [Cydia pomonella]